MGKYKQYLSQFLECKLAKLSERELCNSSRKVVYLYDLEGNYINYYPSISDAARELHIQMRIIQFILNEGRKSRCGYIFSYTKYEKVPNEILVKHNPHKVFQYDLEGKLIASFSSFAEASRKTGIPSSVIYGAVGTRKKIARGFIWKERRTADYLNNSDSKN